jgi:hypothetical protein
MGILVMFSGCAGHSMDTYKDTKPQADIKTYFNGPIKGWGIIQDWRGRVVSRFDVTMVGKWEGDEGTLTENFVYYDTQKTQQRIWHIKKIADGQYEGTASDILGIAKGETFNKVYSFEDTFEAEIKKIESIKLNSMWGTWGMDEAYSSQVLYNKKNEVEIECLSKFGEILNGGRIDCHRSLEVPFNLDTLKNNGYIECHSCRPYLNHKKYLDSIFDNVPKFV